MINAVTLSLCVRRGVTVGKETASQVRMLLFAISSGINKNGVPTVSVTPHLMLK